MVQSLLCCAGLHSESFVPASLLTSFFYARGKQPTPTALPTGGGAC